MERRYRRNKKEEPRGSTKQGSKAEGESKEAHNISLSIKSKGSIKGIRN